MEGYLKQNYLYISLLVTFSTVIVAKFLNNQNINLWLEEYYLYIFILFIYLVAKSAQRYQKKEEILTLDKSLKQLKIKIDEYNNLSDEEKRDKEAFGKATINNIENRARYIEKCRTADLADKELLNIKERLALLENGVFESNRIWKMYDESFIKLETEMRRLKAQVFCFKIEDNKLVIDWDKLREFSPEERFDKSIMEVAIFKLFSESIDNGEILRIIQEWNKIKKMKENAKLY